MRSGMPLCVMDGVFGGDFWGWVWDGMGGREKEGELLSYHFFIFCEFVSGWMLLRLGDIWNGKFVEVRGMHGVLERELLEYKTQQIPWVHSHVEPITGCTINERQEGTAFFFLSERISQKCVNFT